MLSRLTLRWRLTLLNTALFLVVTGVVLTMVYFQNRLVIMRIGAPDAESAPAGSFSGETGRGTEDSAQLADGVAIQRNEALGSLLVQWLVVLIAMTALAGLLAWWATGRVLRRVHRMTSQARRLSMANLHERLALRGPNDEIKELSDTFDALLASLENSFEARTRFIANASHELRTPLAVARTMLQIGLSTADPERLSRVREDLLRNNDRCIALINGLLTLARGEHGLHRREPVDLSAVVDGVIDEVGGVVPADGPRLSSDLPERCVVLGESVLLMQLVHNLVGNAVRYNVAGGQVRVELDPRGILTIANTGQAIDIDQVDRLFEPFYRGAVRTGQADGAGLGLSIVHAIAQSCGGRVTAWPRDGGGLVVQVRIPLATMVSDAQLVGV